MKLQKTASQPGKNIDETAIRNALPVLYKEIGELQLALYAEAKKSLLVIFQGMDASGKDGVIKNVFSETNPMGTRVLSFKKPTEHEYAHDFLWRIHANVPPAGMIHMFNRSHYEEIIIPTVLKSMPTSIINKRYEHINNFERMLEENGTTVLKFFLHVSKVEQKDRLKERLTNPKKFWKHKDEDWESTKKWDQFMKVYDRVFDKCDDIPWHIIPSDKNWYKEFLVAEKVIDALKRIKPKYPALITTMKKSG